MPLIGTRGAASAQGFGEFAQQASGVQANAIDFDGTNDYLIRSTDLTGNTDSSTFTFSVWVWSDVSGFSYIYTTDNTSDSRVQTWISTTQVGLYMKNSAGTVILNASATVPNNNPPKNTWINILWSINLASTSNRSCYINDVLQSTVSWDTYTNGSIDFTQPNHNIAGGPALGGYTKARLSNVYLDKTYRDMSVTANRRLFVTADLKPAAGQAALNPILYLPMSDPTQPGKNMGTGGDFTLTGTVARSGRGPNQYNAPYSDFDGAADYLSRTTAPTGIADSNTFTVHCAFTADSVSTAQKIVFFGSDASNRFQVAIDPSGQISLQGYNASGTQLLGVTTVASIVVGRNYVLDVSVELFNSSSRHFFINGQAASVTWNVYTGGFIDFNIATTPRYHIGANTNTGSPSQFFNGRLGALWFSTNYIDLSVPANLAKFVSGTGINAAPVDLGATGELPTGTSPLIYLPMYGNAAGLNYGTGGNFTVNSGPYTGARGPNEWWGNWLRVPSGTGYYIRRTAGLTGITNTSDFTFSCWFYVNVQGGFPLFYIPGTVNGYQRLGISMDNGQLKVLICNSSDNAYVLVFNSSSSALVTAGSYYNLLVSRNGTTLNCYLNGVAVTGTQSPSGSGVMTVTGMPVYVGAERDTQGSTGDFYIGELYFNTGYTDFSQEANRLKFRDCFGNPTDLPSAITAGSVPTPLVYLRMDPASPGTNAGTGGAFTSTLNIDKGQF